MCIQRRDYVPRVRFSNGPVAPSKRKLKSIASSHNTSSMRVTRLGKSTLPRSYDILLKLVKLQVRVPARNVNRQTGRDRRKEFRFLTKRNARIERENGLILSQKASRLSSADVREKPDGADI